MATPKPVKTKSKAVRKGLENAEPATIKKIQEAAKLLAKGKSRATIIEWLMDTYGFAPTTAARYYESAVLYILPDDDEQYRQNLIKANTTRLETIIERAMEERQYKVAREAIAELNKMAGIRGEGVQVGINTDKQNDTQQIIIKFDQ